MNPKLDNSILDTKIKQILQKYTAAIYDLEKNIAPCLPEAIHHLSTLSTKISFLGVGKAGLVARKTAATFSSLGLPSFFIHPADALHGDLGSIEDKDTCIIFSNSGESEELLNLLPTLKARKAFIVSITGRPHSTLAKAANINIPIGAVEEICHLGIAPTLSTTIMMILGDILAVLTSEHKNFTREAYSLNHPLGTIGKKLLAVKEIMRCNFPMVTAQQSIKEVLLSITQHRTGSALIVNDNKQLIGIFTDGDLRRHLHKITSLEIPIEGFMTKNPKTIDPEDKVVDAMVKFTTFRCDEFPVVDQQGKILGLLDIQDLVKLGVDIQA